MPQDDFSPRALHLNDLLALAPWIPAGPICDLGCGAGHLAAALAAYGFAVTALDVDRERLEQARQCYGEQVDWVHSDVRAYRLQRESYAALFCLNLFPYIPNGERARMIGRFKAAVKPGGWLIVSGLTQADPSAQEKWARSSNQISCMPTGLLAEDELEQRFKDWQIHFYFKGQTQLACGPAGPARHAVAQVMAQKPLESADGSRSWRHLPQLGVGQTHDPLAKSLSQAQFLEVRAEDYLDPSQDFQLARLTRGLPSVLRAQTLSLGSSPWRYEAYLAFMLRLLARCDSPWWVSPLGYLRTEQREAYTVQPLPLTEEALEVVKQNIRHLRQQIPVPLVLEASLQPSPFSSAEMDPVTFLRHIAEEADCGIALDLSQAELGMLPGLERLPKERIVQISLRATHAEAGTGRETHWLQLIQSICQQSPIKAICLPAHASADWFAACQAALKWVPLPSGAEA